MLNTKNFSILDKDALGMVFFTIVDMDYLDRCIIEVRSMVNQDRSDVISIITNCVNNCEKCYISIIILVL